MYISLRALSKKISKSITRNSGFLMELAMGQLQMHPLERKQYSTSENSSIHHLVLVRLVQFKVTWLENLHLGKKTNRLAPLSGRKQKNFIPPNVCYCYLNTKHSESTTDLVQTRLTPPASHQCWPRGSDSAVALEPLYKLISKQLMNKHTTDCKFFSRY